MPASPEHRRSRRRHCAVPGGPAVQHGGGRFGGQRLVRGLRGHTQSVRGRRTALHRQAVQRPGHADRLRTGSRPPRRIRQPLSVGGPTRCSRPGPRAVHGTAAGRAQRLRVQLQRQLLGAECRVHTDRAVLDHERRAGNCLDDADPTERGRARRRELDGSCRAGRALRCRGSTYGGVRQLGTHRRAPTTVRGRCVPGVAAGRAARPARHRRHGEPPRHHGRPDGGLRCARSVGWRLRPRSLGTDDLARDA